MSKADPATLFAALGDPTRIALVARLGDGLPRSIVQAGEGLPITRQAIAKHLDILHRAGLLARAKSGRETRFVLRPQGLDDARDWLTQVGAQWDETLARLKSFVEDNAPGGG